jgi:hypothetical protein
MLADRVRVERSVKAGQDQWGNDRYATEIVIDERPCRIFRGRGTHERMIRQGVEWDSRCVFKYHTGDDVKEGDEVLVNGRRWDLVNVQLMKLVLAPSHWELELAKVGEPQ